MTKLEIISRNLILEQPMLGSDEMTFFKFHLQLCIEFPAEGPVLTMIDRGTKGKTFDATWTLRNHFGADGE